MTRSTRRHDLVRVRHGGALRQRQPQDPAVRGVASGQQVHGVVRRARHAGSCRGCPPAPPRQPSESWRRRKICHSPPSPFCTRSISQRPSADVDRTFSAMRSSATPSGKSSRSAAAAEVAEPHLLLEPGGIGNAGVPEPGPVVAPGHRPAHQVDVRDRFVDDLAARDVEDVQRPVLGPVLRQRDREPVPVRRRDEPVDRGLARRVDGFRIHDDALGAGVVQVREGHQERPLPRRLLLQREEGAPARGQARVRRAFGPEQLLDARPQRIAPRQRLEVRAGQLLLRLSSRRRSPERTRPPAIGSPR